MKNPPCAHTTRGSVAFSNMAAKSCDSTRTIAPDALIACAMADAAAAAPDAAIIPAVVPLLTTFSFLDPNDVGQAERVAR